MQSNEACCTASGRFDNPFHITNETERASTVSGSLMITDNGVFGSVIGRICRLLQLKDIEEYKS